MGHCKKQKIIMIIENGYKIDISCHEIPVLLKYALLA